MADEAKHTPGPWRAGRMDMVSYPCDGREGPVKAVYVDDPHGRVHMGERLPAVVAEAYDALGCDCRANALLIAAAPELLAACEAFHEFMREVTVADEGLWQAWHKTAAAIAKAKGG